MPPKKEAAADDHCIKGFDAKETKLLAAAFLASTDVGRVDYKVMAELTGNTAGTAQKYWGAVRRKGAAMYPEFAKMTGLPGEGKAAGLAKGRKRKADATEADIDAEENDADVEPSDEKETNGKGKDEPKAKDKTKAKGKTPLRKKTKVAEPVDDEGNSDDEHD